MVHTEVPYCSVSFSCGLRLASSSQKMSSPLTHLYLVLKASSFTSTQTTCSQDTLIPSMSSQHVLNNARFSSHKQIPTSATVLIAVSSGSSQSRQGSKSRSAQQMPPSAFRLLNSPRVGSENSCQILQLLTRDRFSCLLGQPLPTVIHLV